MCSANESFNDNAKSWFNQFRWLEPKIMYGWMDASEIGKNFLQTQT